MCLCVGVGVGVGVGVSLCVSVCLCMYICLPVCMPFSHTCAENQIPLSLFVLFTFIFTE